MTGGTGAGRRGRLLLAGLAALVLALLLAALWYTRPRPLKDWPGFPAGGDAAVWGQASWVETDPADMGWRTAVLEAGDPHTRDFLDALGEMACAPSLKTLFHRGDTWSLDGGGAPQVLLYLAYPGGRFRLSLCGGQGLALSGGTTWYVRMEEEDVHWVWDRLMDMGTESET